MEQSGGFPYFSKIIPIDDVVILKLSFITNFFTIKTHQKCLPKFDMVR